MNVSPPSSAFQLYSLSFNIAADGNHTIAFVTPAKSGDNGSFIDSVILQ
jgi:hypothetical protein